MSDKQFTNNKAITSLTLGILSIVIPVIGLFCAIAGIYYYKGSMKEIKTKDEAGMNVAIAGLVCSIVGIIIQLLYILAIIAYFAVTGFIEQVSPSLLI
ncbi:DUF4190 domain-containing protein [Halobacillus sp. MO56]